MEYEFKRQEPCTERLLFALSLNGKGMKERIMVGTETEILKKLWGETETCVYYDSTRPLGTLFIDFRQDKENGWMDNGFLPLWNALHTNRFHQPRLEQQSADFLTAKFDTNEPLAVYAALRLWNGYLRARLPRDRDFAAEGFRADLTRLVQPFSECAPEKLRSREFAGAIRQSAAELKLDLWYPAKTDAEVAVCYGSFLPAFLYYHSRLGEWGYCFRECKVCGKIFLAKSLKYEICSDKCRKVKNRQNKRDFDERARENKYDLIYKNETQHWRNRLNKAKKDASLPAEKLLEMEQAFKQFKKEALKRKNDVKSGKATEREFRDWIYQQYIS